ncbi:MAG TPA: hypothetical protein PKG77_25185 [Phycisphaerae bacterium]|nr:hypothetical protein [Phycisphaerae bacterium]
MVKNLSLTTRQVARAIGTCPTAASRKVQDAEDLLDACIRQARRLSRSGRRDRVRSLVVQRLRVVASLAANHPEQLPDWIDRLIGPDAGRKAVR